MAATVPGATLAPMEFWKAHGTANDFVVLRDPDDRVDLPVDLVRALCDRRRGVGADGVLRLGAPSGDADVFMDYRNADGSVAEMCGNGVRVVAKHVVDHGLVAPRDGVVVVGTRAGDKRVVVERGGDGRVVSAQVDMGPPSFEPADVPFEANDWRDTVSVDGAAVAVAALSMGNPHAVIEVDDVAGAPVREVGGRLEVHARFPERTNVEFVAVRSDTEVDLRVWERGIGETASCGTGICAAWAALRRLGKVRADGTVTVPGGTLTLRYEPDDHPSVFLTGPAVEVAVGTLDATWLAAATSGAIRGQERL